MRRSVGVRVEVVVAAPKNASASPTDGVPTCRAGFQVAVPAPEPFETLLLLVELVALANLCAQTAEHIIPDI